MEIVDNNSGSGHKLRFYVYYSFVLTTTQHNEILYCFRFIILLRFDRGLVHLQLRFCWCFASKRIHLRMEHPE